MKKFLLLVIFVLLIVPSAYSKSLMESESTSKINFGTQVGFASTHFDIEDILVQGHHIEKLQSTSQVGHFISLVARMTLHDRFYLQTEIMPTYMRAAIEFDKNSWDEDATEKSPTSFTMEGYYIEIPLLIGYNVVSDGPYSMSVFTGPKLTIPFTHTYSAEFGSFGQEGLNEKPSPYTLNWTMGLGFKIGRAFFNFNYNFGLNNISDRINYSTPPVSAEDFVSIDRKIRVFAFGLGVMF